MQLQQDDPSGNKIDLQEDTPASKEMMEKLTRLSNLEQMQNFLTYGEWDLTDKKIERLKKDEEMKQRVSLTNSLTQ